MTIYIYRMNVKDKFYVGSTKDIIQRKKFHKYRCYNQNDINHYNLKVYKYIRNNCDNWCEVSFNILDVYDDISKKFRKDIEQYYIDYFSNNLNSIGAKFIQEKRDITDKIKNEKRREKIICECGRVVNFSSIDRHRKSKIHQKLLNKQIIS